MKRTNEKVIVSNDDTVPICSFWGTSSPFIAIFNERIYEWCKTTLEQLLFFQISSARISIGYSFGRVKAYFGYLGKKHRGLS